MNPRTQGFDELKFALPPCRAGYLRPANLRSSRPPFLQIRGIVNSRRLSDLRIARRLVPLVILAALTACADQTTETAPIAKPDAARMVTAPFACGVSYTSTNTFYDADLAEYGIPEVTTTHENCETWTGNDYRLFVQETGSTVSDPEVANDVTTSWYEYGVTRGYDSQGVEIADATQVAADAFALGLATPEEKQASYNEPYYAVYSGGEPCGTRMCDQQQLQSLSPSGAQASMSVAGNGNPDAHKVGTKEHGLRRPAMRALLGASDEIGRNGLGHRRFRTIRGEQETIVTVDPATELMVGQEVKGPQGHTRATMRWMKIKRKNGTEGYMRQSMTVEGVNGHGKQTSRSTVVITNISFGEDIR